MSQYASRLGPVAFDPEAVHRSMMERADYLGCPEIASVLEWRDDPKASNADKVFYNDDEDMGDLNSEGALMCVVASVLPDRPYAKSTGNYNPAYKSPLCDAKIQLTFGTPADTCPALENDFKQALATLNDLQHAIATTSKLEHFLVNYKGSYALRMSMPIFKPRETPFDANNAADPILTYPVPPEYGQALFEVAHSYELNPLRIFDVNNRPIPASVLESHLIGAVVEVWFQLQHYAMKGPGRYGAPPVSDTFTARFAQLRVLRPPRASGQSPLYSRSLDMGAYIPQGSPNHKLRRAQKAAAGSTGGSPAQLSPSRTGVNSLRPAGSVGSLLPSPILAGSHPLFGVPTGLPYPMTPDRTPPSSATGSPRTPQGSQQTTIADIISANQTAPNGSAGYFPGGATVQAPSVGSPVSGVSPTPGSSAQVTTLASIMQPCAPAASQPEGAAPLPDSGLLNTVPVSTPASGNHPPAIPESSAASDTPAHLPGGNTSSGMPVNDDDAIDTSATADGKGKKRALENGEDGAVGGGQEGVGPVTRGSKKVRPTLTA